MIVVLQLLYLNVCGKSNLIFLIFSSSWPAMCIHGDKSQPEREWVLKGRFFLHIQISDMKVL